MTLGTALLRGAKRAPDRWVPPLFGASLALGAAAVGVLVWNARYGWPDWFTLLWLPPLVLITRPANRRATMLGIAIVAGSAAGHARLGRRNRGPAPRGAGGYGRARRPSRSRVGAELRSLGDSLALLPVPHSAPELYALWRSTALGRQGRPVVLGVWRADGTSEVELELDELDLPGDSVAARVRALLPAEQVSVSALFREPATHYLLLVRGRESCSASG
jgi:hypothetical protein